VTKQRRTHLFTFNIPHCWIRKHIPAKISQCRSGGPEIESQSPPRSPRAVIGEEILSLCGADPANRSGCQLAWPTPQAIPRPIRQASCLTNGSPALHAVHKTILPIISAGIGCGSRGDGLLSRPASQGYSFSNDQVPNLSDDCAQSTRDFMWGMD
jgi:hypothetical protein